MEEFYDDEVVEVLSSFDEHSPETKKNPCDECPWRRTATKGFLGPHTPEEWVTIAHGDGPIACHQTIHHDDERWHADTLQCAGAAIYRANTGKMPRVHGVAVGIPNRDAVFSTPTEFVEHHRNEQSEP